MSRLMWVLLVAGCATSDATPKPTDGIAVELASITLGDDCGGSLPLPVLKADQAESKPDADAKRRAPTADRISADDDALDGGCVQTSMQLSLKSSAAMPTAIKVKKVELLDDKGKLLEPLLASKPSKWTGKKYEKWNEAIAAAETLQTSYVLSVPNWNKLTKGRRNAQSRTFLVRVTLTVGTKDRTVEKQATAAAMIEPDVDT